MKYSNVSLLSTHIPNNVSRNASALLTIQPRSLKQTRMLVTMNRRCTS